MPTTDQLKQTIESNNLIITTLTEKAQGMWKEVETKQKEHNANLFQFFKNLAIIPDKILSSGCEAFVTNDYINIRWNDFGPGREGYRTTFEIQIQDKYRYSGKEDILPEYIFEISSSSSRITISHNPDKQDSLEKYYYNKLSANVADLLLESVNFRNELIKFITTASVFANEAHKMNSAIDQLKRANTEAEKEIKRNEMVYLVKPHGETSTHTRLGVDINMFTYNEHGQPDSYRYGRARWKYHYFDAINLVKETKKYIEVDFIRFFKGKDDNTGEETITRSVQGTHRLEIGAIINLLSSNKTESDRMTARKKEKEESQKKAVA